MENHQRFIGMMCSKSQGSTTRDKYPQHQRRNRPGCNSYLKIVLDERMMAVLHRSTRVLKNVFWEEAERSNASAPTAKAFMNRSSRGGQAPRPLSIHPRSLDSLHMTFFFGGEVLTSLSAEELTTWHSEVEALFTRSGFYLRKDMDSTLDVAGTESEARSNDAKYWLRVRDIRLFPPRRNNLIVAVLDASAAWHELYQGLRQIAKSSSCQSLAEVVNFSKEVWVPHITLANIRGQGTADQREVLQSLLDSMVPTLQNDSNNEPLALQPTYIGMGGPMPNATILDWNFYPMESI